MTQIEFVHGVTDKPAAAARIVGELYRQGSRVTVFVPDAAIAERIDRILWTQPATGFLPHCAAESPLAAQTPIVIATDLERSPHDEVLINLDGDLPPSFARFQRLIEVVGSDEGDRVPARARFRFYRDRGYPLLATEFSPGTPA